MDKKILEPKVFISYASTSEEYTDKVLAFASRLQGEMGIEVIIDKVALSAGQELNDFMEKCVKDESINYVIILLNKTYAEKADSRNGGVGIEAQIISEEIYKNVSQTRFIPVIFEKGENKEVFKPVFLTSRFHYDLDCENAEIEFIKLVRHIYGLKDYSLPEKAKTPDFILNPISPIQPITFLNSIKNSSYNEKRQKVSDKLDEILNTFLSRSGNEISSYEELLKILDDNVNERDAFIDIIGEICVEDFFVDLIISFFEKFYNISNNTKSILRMDSLNFSLYEFFVYTVCCLFKKEEFNTINILLNTTYFVLFEKNYVEQNFINVFTSSRENIDNAKNKKDNKQYFSGFAKILVERINKKFTKEFFVFIDLFLFNFSLISKKENFIWFPRTYIYGGYGLQNNEFVLFAKKLKSQRCLQKYSGLFGTSNKEEIKKMLQKIENDGMEYRYGASFEKPVRITDIININDVGSLN